MDKEIVVCITLVYFPDIYLSVLILGIRHEYHQIYIFGEKNISKLMEDIVVVELQQLDCFLCLFLCSLWPSFPKQIISTLLINHLSSISSPITMTRLNRLGDVNT